MSQLPPGFVLDSTPASNTPGPVYGAPPKPEKPDAPKTTYRPMTPDEVRQRGLDPAKPYQISSEGKVDPLTNGDTKPTEYQSKSAGFLGRMLQAEKQFGAVPADSRDARTVPGQLLANTFPDFDAALNSSDRVSADNAARNFIAASLRQESGAAIGREEYINQYRIFFPMPGDTAQQIKEKELARKQAIEGFKIAAGPLLEEALAGVQDVPARDAPTDGQPQEEEPGLSGSVTDDTPWPNKPGNNVPPSGGNGPTSNWDAIGSSTGDIIASAANNTVGLVSNPVSTVIGRAMGYDNYTADLGETIRSALDLPNNSSQTVKAINQGAAGGLSVGGVARKAGQVLGNNALKAFGSTPVLDAATGATAAAAGEGARQAGFGPVGQAAATLAGGFAPSAAMGGRNALLNVTGRNPRGPAPDGNVIAAGQRQGVPIRQPDARPELRGDYAALESTERAGPMIAAARTKDAEAIATRANEVTGGTAFDRADNTALGQSVQKTAERAEADVKGVANTLYQRAEREAPDFATPSTQTNAFIDSKIAELKAASPTGYNAEISALEAMKSDLAQTGLSVRTLQAQRETVGGRIGDNMQDRSRADRTFTEVLKVAGEELHGALRTANPRAAEILKRADAKWGQYKRLQKEVTGLFLGKRGDATAETAARNLNATTRNNYSALRRFMTMATPDEKADFAATFVKNWGSTARGDFSPAIYAKSMESVSDRTLDALVGTEGRKALRDLQVISNAKTDAMGRLAPSGKAIGGMKGGLRTLILSTLGLSGGGFAGAVALPMAGNFFAKIGEERAARLMLNPDFTKWLRAMPEATNPKAINAYFGKLKASGARSQVAANDIEAFTAAVVESFAQSPRRAAAQEEDN